MTLRDIAFLLLGAFAVAAVQAFAARRACATRHPNDDIANK